MDEPADARRDVDRTMIVEGGAELQHHALGQQRDGGVQAHGVIEQPSRGR